MSETLFSREEILRITRELFSEAYAGPLPEWSWFVTAESGSGIFGNLETLTAEQASWTPTPNGRSIAAHTEHLRWSLVMVNRTLQGEPWAPDWSESWLVQIVNETEWQDLQTGLRQEFQQLLAALNENLEINHPAMLQGLLALAPHAAYHLGAIRQMALIVSR